MFLDARTERFCDSTAELHFPPLERKFDGPHWDHATAKSTVTQWFTILGF